MGTELRKSDMMVVAYRKMTVHYKVWAPSTEAIEDWEHDMLRGGGFDVKRAMTNGRKQTRNGVIVEPAISIATCEGTEPFFRTK